MSTHMMSNPANGQPVINGNAYRAGPDGTAVVADGDVAGMQALGWVALTQRMIGPSSTPSVAIGGTGYILGADRTFWAAPGDVAQLAQAGCTPISAGYVAPTPPPPPTFTMLAPTPNAPFLVRSRPGNPYQSNASGVIAAVAPVDAADLQAAGCLITAMTTPAGVTHTATVS